VHLVGLIIRIYHDAQSPEHQTSQHCVTSQRSKDLIDTMTEASNEVLEYLIQGMIMPAV